MFITVLLKKIKIKIKIKKYIPSCNISLFFLFGFETYEGTPSRREVLYKEPFISRLRYRTISVQDEVL